MTVYTAEQLRRALAAFNIPDDFELTPKAVRAVAEREVRKLIRSVKLSGQSPDPTCDFHYAPERAADRVTVRRMIVMHQLFERLHPGVPLWPLAEREEIKHLAWRVVHNPDASFEQRLDAALRVMKTHYARSVRSTLRTHSPLSFAVHPGFDEYARHYIHSDPTDIVRRFGEKITQELLALYTRPDPVRIGPGSTYWRSGF
ncbi:MULTISPECIES: hypothetical protein [unclassified Caballeronia]|uniref:hypothetical protein n=1 Tax=unclassified Caballeronia TaxID=2646786 RepID=UPI002864C095|nr:MULTISPECIES: hypothetical protein [unclassified Caballeronia]MDR5777706.1 hypothetical protein [Caballeronia sp. LZ002]MDR5853146.1 hypothetical protein [Caballeronia sp. LZ003]